MNWRRVGTIVKKEVLELLLDRYTAVIALLLPILFLFGFAYALNFDVTRVKLAIWDQDSSAASRAYVAAYTSSEYFRLVEAVSSAARLQYLLAADQADMGLVIPSGFGRALAAGQTARVQTLVDGSFSPTAQVQMAYGEAVNAQFGAGRARPDFPVATQIWYNAGLNSKNFIVPGLLAVILMAFPPLLSALAIAREKEQGSIQLLFISPARPAEIVVGKLLPYVALGMLQLLLVLAAGVFWFRVPFRGSLPLFLLVGCLYVVTTVSLGLLVSVLTSTQLAAIFLTLVITLMPAMLFSGFIYPLANMPPALQYYSHLFPATYFIQVVWGIIIKGEGLDMVWAPVLVLAVQTALLLGLCAWGFKKRLD